MKHFCVLIFALSLTACQGYFDAPAKENADKVRARPSVRGESVSCINLTVQSVKQKDGSVLRTSTQTKNQMTRYLHSDLSGFVKITDATGEITFITTRLSTGSEDAAQGDYTYTLHRETRSENLAANTIHDVMHTVTTMTGKNGYQFVGNDGKSVPTLSTDQTDETVSRMEGTSRHLVSAKRNGQDLPNADYVTETAPVAKSKAVTEHTWLRSPTPSRDGTAEGTLESDDTTCTIAPTK